MSLTCVSRINLDPLLSMAILPMEVADDLKSLGIHFDCKLTWSYLFDQLTIHCYQ